MRKLTDPWVLGGVPIPNRVVLAPLAGIGNWFVRLQAKRHGAGLAVSEMVSSHAIHYGSRRTHEEMLRIHPDEGIVSLQLFGQDPEIMRSAATTAARSGADLIDLNMGCPVPKVTKTGAGAALLRAPDLAVEIARAALEGSGLPVTVKLRAEGFALAPRLAEAGVAGITFHPRNVKVRHKGFPDYDLASELVDALSIPVIVSGGMNGAEHIRWVFEHTGCAAVMIARGSFGNPWIFQELVGLRDEEPSRAEIIEEWLWVLDRAAEHFGEERANRYLRKFHPWYVERLGEGRAAQDTLQRAQTLAQSREFVESLAGAVLSSRAA